MAKKIVEFLTDDLTGEELDRDGGQTVTFGIEGQTYEIDLSNANVEKMRNEFGMYVEHARKMSRTAHSGRTRTTGGGGRTTSDREQTQAIREWAKQHGITVADRGRIPADLREMYLSGKTPTQTSIPTPAKPEAQEKPKPAKKATVDQAKEKEPVPA